MRVIRSYALERNRGRNLVMMPAGAHILSMETMEERPVLYAIVDPTAPLVEKDIRGFVTGFDGFTDENDDTVQYRHLATLTFARGAFVVHFFEFATLEEMTKPEEEIKP